MVAWARKHGIQSTIHTGGPSIPGSGLIDKDVVLEADADVIGHINGGHTSLPEAHVCELCEVSSRAIELVHNGNDAWRSRRSRRQLATKNLHRVILGTDSPAGSGVQPLGILRMIALLSVSAGWRQNSPLPAPRQYGAQRRLNCGLIEAGKPETSCSSTGRSTRWIGCAEEHRARRSTRIGMVMIDGIVRCGRSRNTPPAERVPELVH